MKVTVPVDRCPTSLPVLGQRPKQDPTGTCAGAFGAGSICFDPANATKLAALLDALSGLYRERAACETGGYANSPPSSPVSVSPDR